MAPQEERDYRAEIELHLSVLFGDSVQSYDLINDTNITILGPHAPTTYSLTLHVRLNISDWFKDHRDLDHLDRFRIGNIRPHLLEMSQDYAHGHMVLHAKYAFMDLEEFIGELGKTAWERYQADFNETVDKTLQDKK